MEGGNSHPGNHSVVVAGSVGPSNAARGVIAARYEIRNQIGSGTYGSVYSGKDRVNGRPVAIKISTTQTGIATVTNEAHIYGAIRSLYPTYRGFAKFYYNEVTRDPLGILILEMLGRSISDVLGEYLRKNSRHFSNKRIMKIGIQAVHHIRMLHSVGYMHEDIKPNNILVGRENDRRVVLIDFGLSKKIFGPHGNHVRYSRETGLSVNLFSSRARIFGSPPGRRDDLESLGMCFVYLKTSRLPWSEAARGKRGVRLLEHLRWAHRRVSTRQLCEGFGEHLENYFSHLRSLDFRALPNYQYLIDCLEAVKTS